MQPRLLAALSLAVSCSNTTINQVNINTTNNHSTLVGAMGATIGNPSGNHVVVPAGALTSEVTIKLGEVIAADEPKLAALPAGTSAASAVVVLEPHGQTFGAAVTLSIQLTGSPSGEIKLLRAERPESTSWTEVPILGLDSTRVLAESRGFSLYRLAAVQAVGGNDAGVPSADGGIDDPCPAAVISNLQRQVSTFQRALADARRCDPAGSGQCSGEHVFQAVLGDGELAATPCYFLNQLPEGPLPASWNALSSDIIESGIDLPTLFGTCGLAIDEGCGPDGCAIGCSPAAGRAECAAGANVCQPSAG